MADNVDITAGTGTTIRTDDVGGVQYPASKLVVGADGVDGGFVSAVNPLPVTGAVTTGALTDVELRAVPVPVSGTVATGGLTDAEIRATPLPVSGTVTANAATSHGKTITYVSIDQGAAGTTALAAASPGNKHKLLGLVVTMSLAGTVKLTDGGTDATGAMDVAASGGFVLPTSIVPYVVGTANTALNLVTTVGAAKGVAIILTEA